MKQVQKRKRERLAAKLTRKYPRYLYPEEVTFLVSYLGRQSKPKEEPRVLDCLESVNSYKAGYSQQTSEAPDPDSTPLRRIWRLIAGIDQHEHFFHGSYVFPIVGVGHFVTVLLRCNQDDYTMDLTLWDSFSHISLEFTATMESIVADAPAQGWTARWESHGLGWQDYDNWANGRCGFFAAWVINLLRNHLEPTEHNGPTEAKMTELVQALQKHIINEK